MKTDAIIEIDGCKITPEFIELLNDTLLKDKRNLDEFKKSLFSMQCTLIDQVARSGEIPGNLTEVNNSIYTVNEFVDGLQKLRNEGKF